MAHNKETKTEKIGIQIHPEIKTLLEKFSDDSKKKTDFSCSGNIRILAVYTLLKLLSAQNPRSKDDLRIHLKNMKEFNEGEMAKQIINHFVNNKIKGEKDGKN